MKTRRLLALSGALLLSTGLLAVGGSAQAASTAHVSILPRGARRNGRTSTPTARHC